MARQQKISKERKEFIKEFIAEHNISTAKDIEEALKDIFKDSLQEMLEAEMSAHLGHEKYEYTDSQKYNYRNGVSSKNIHSSSGDFRIEVPRDRNGDFDPIIVEKGSNDISNIEQKIINTGKDVDICVSISI